ncbi:MAG: RNA methyltransferase [bacterium]|nr:RNA methyltransferase [bacterium]
MDSLHAMWKDKGEMPDGPRAPVAALLDNIRSAYNVGDMFRSSDALRLAELNLVGITAFPPNGKLEKTALGTTATVPWRHDLRVFDAVAHVRSRGYALIAIEMTPASENFFTADIPAQSCFVFGHEVLGVDRELLRQADSVLHLPMAGYKNSLNVSSTFAIVLYHHLVRHGMLDFAPPQLDSSYLPDKRSE